MMTVSGIAEGGRIVDWSLCTQLCGIIICYISHLYIYADVALQLGSTECVDEGDEATLTITKNGEHQEPIIIVVTTIDGTASGRSVA